jgi:hypothetical protein
MKTLVCPICQCEDFEDESEQTSRCLDCLAVIDSETMELLEYDGVKA